MAKGQDLAPFPTKPVPNVPRDARGPRGRSPSPSLGHLLIEAGPCPPAHLPAAELIHYPSPQPAALGNFSLIKRVKPRGWGLAGSGQEDPAEDPPRSPHGDVRWSEAHTLGDTLEMPRAGEKEPCTGGIPALEQRGNRAPSLLEPCNIPAKLRGDQALVLQWGWGVPVLCPHPQTAWPCRASVSPLHYGLAPTTQGPAEGCWGPGLCGWQWPGRAAALQAALLG